MENNIAKRKKLVAAYCVVYTLLILLSLLFICLKDPAKMELIYIFNISVDVFAMITGLVLFASYVIDVQKTGNDSKYYLYLLNTVFLGLFTDLSCWLLEKEASLRLLNLLCNTLYYMCLPLAAYFFWRYIKQFFIEESKFSGRIEKFMFWGLITAMIMRVVNMFTGIYFTIDPAGIYTRSRWYILSMIYAFATLYISGGMIILNRRNLEKEQLFVLILYVITPTLAALFTIFLYGLSVSYGVLMLVLLLMYCVLNIQQGREKSLMQRDLNTARSIQEDALPHEFPPFPDRTEFDLYASMDPAKEVGGDFYDFFLIDDDHLCLVIADVSGKGIPGALMMMSSKNILYNNALQSESPAEILAEANETICRNNTEEMFITIWLGILEISSGKLTAANAGHEYPVIRRPGGCFELFKDRHGFVVGGMSGVRYKDYELQLEAGTKLFLYTDGIPEATDLNKELFGTDRMLEALNQEPDASAKKLLENVMNAAAAFTGKAEQFDDMTMLCLEYRGKKENCI